MCVIFKRKIILVCQSCKEGTPHLLDKVINCSKAKFRCYACGRSNGLRIPGIKPA